MRKNSNQQNQQKGLMPQSAASRISSLFRNPHSAIRNSERGFTLIELAIVLVIIGIILGAVLKGQDLIENARAKKFASEIKQWEITIYNYYDRKGRFPGDDNKDGVIGGAGDTAGQVQTDITNANFVNAPHNTFALGATTYYVFLGNNGAASPRNYLVVCKSATCATAFSNTNSADLAALKMFESFDTSIDSSADATVGYVTGATAVTITSNVATAITAGSDNVDWTLATTIKALAYQVK